MIEVLNVLCWFLVVSGLLLYIWCIVIMKSYKFITSKRRYEEKWMGGWYETTKERYEALKDDNVVRIVK